jgi:hypothetical protein
MSKEISLDTLAGMIKAGFDEVSVKFEEVHARIDGVEVSLGKKIDDLDTKLEAVEASLRVEITATREEMRQGFANVNRVLNDYEDRITNIEHDLAP